MSGLPGRDSLLRYPYTVVSYRFRRQTFLIYIYLVSCRFWRQKFLTHMPWFLTKTCTLQTFTCNGFCSPSEVFLKKIYATHSLCSAASYFLAKLPAEIPTKPKIQNKKFLRLKNVRVCHLTKPGYLCCDASRF